MCIIQTFVDSCTNDDVASFSSAKNPKVDETSHTESLQCDESSKEKSSQPFQGKNIFDV